MSKPKLKFFDVKNSKSFITNKYVIKIINTSRGLRNVAIAKNNGNFVYRFVSV